MRVATAIAVLTVVLLAGCGGSSTLTAKQLRKEGETVHSAAAEGALLAAGVADERTTEPFTRVHAEALAKQAGTAASTLSGAKATGAVAVQGRQLARRARRVEAALQDLSAAADDPAVGRRVERELRRLAG
jgi:hypothetical protein